MTSPVVLVALAVLLLNDHVLKRAWPGAVTGKLSDVAGPVVAAALLGALARAACGRREARAARSEAAAWWAVAVAFALCKTVPAVNDAVPLAGVRDPWDALGLLALPVAWRLSRLSRPAPRVPWRRAARGAVVVVAVLAVSATTSHEHVRLVHLDASGSSVVATGEGESRRPAYRYDSRDGGRTWDPAPAATRPPRPEAARGRAQACGPTRCYDLGTGAVRESRDGGGSWRLSWAPERGEPEDRTLADVTFVPGTDTVLVAYDRWVLRREGDGEWERIAVAPEATGGLLPSVPVGPVAALLLAFVVVAILVAAASLAVARSARGAPAADEEDSWLPPPTASPPARSGGAGASSPPRRRTRSSPRRSPRHRR